MAHNRGSGRGGRNRGPNRGHGSKKQQGSGSNAAIIQQVLPSLFNHADGFLDLSNLRTKFSGSNPTDRTFVMNLTRAICDQYRNVVSISLEGNNIRTLEPWRDLCQLPMLQNISLNNNDIRSLGELQHLSKAPQVTNLLIQRNPIEPKLSLEEIMAYVSHKMTSVRTVEGQPLPPGRLNLAPGLVHKIEHKSTAASGSMNRMNNASVTAFVRTFLTAYDARNSTLASMYHEFVHFSLSTMPTLPAPASSRHAMKGASKDSHASPQARATWQAYQSPVVNHGTTNAAMGPDEALRVGRQPVLELIGQLPRSQFAGESLQVEVVLRTVSGRGPTQQKPNLVTVLVEGKYLEQPKTSMGVTRMFSRTLVLAQTASSGQFMVTNDMLRLGEYQPKVTRELARQMTEAKAAPSTANPFVTQPQPAMEEIVRQLKTATGMRTVHCRELLEASKWDVGLTSANLEEFKRTQGGKIPDHMLGPD
ncbi:Nuclear transport factor 2 (NTF2) domain [Carpediemonas membranifera]|uniref:Nuclear transport factor 2 (NTF2) domain n=1 Tax=Carpediemonas membranifera TaxID=201153 RepID=A0A8J6B015_9EUKA|nr:Nuclear transport factor 2 (NTF2) domain [Carpediemonas membranifera]|eukprot:KAG9390062.1 Nuclear transport factor 2 (NTF2) domain [Carpediemonas membranifera]